MLLERSHRVKFDWQMSHNPSTMRVRITPLQPSVASNVDTAAAAEAGVFLSVIRNVPIYRVLIRRWPAITGCCWKRCSQQPDVRSHFRTVLLNTKSYMRKLLATNDMPRHTVSSSNCRKFMTVIIVINRLSKRCDK